MSVDTKTFILQHQILDLSAGGVTLSGVEAREIIEDYLANALAEGDNISIVYTDVPTPGIVEIGTTSDISITGDIHCNDLYTAASGIYLGALHLTYNGTHLVIPAEVQADGDIGTSGDLYIGTDLTIRQIDNYNIVFGYGDVGAGLTSGATDNIFIGRDAGKETTASDYSVYIGYRAGYETGISYTGTHENVFIGREAGREAQWQRQSVFIGPYAGALASDNNSYYNIAIGYQAGYRLRNSYNVVIGYNAMTSEAGTDSYQYRNVILGYQAGSVLTGNDNICIGYRAGGYMYAHLNDNVAIGAHAMTTDHGVGTSNEQRGSVALGYQALYIQESTPGSLGYYNVVIGRRAGYCNNQQLMGKDYNTLLGAHAGEGSSGDSNVFVGYQAGTNVSESNRLYIANTNTATPLIYGEFDTPMLQFNGDIYFTSYTISGTGDIYCNDLYTSGNSIHLGDLRLSHNGSVFNIPSNILISGTLDVNNYIGTSGAENFIYCSPNAAEDWVGMGLAGDNTYIFLDGGDETIQILSAGICYVEADNSLILRGTNYLRLTGAGNNIYLNSDGFLFGANTISGTGNIYCNDLYASGSTVHIGDYIELSDTGSALAINAPIQVNGGVLFGANTVSGTGDIYCGDLYTAASGIYIGGLHLSYSGTHLIVPSELQVTGDIGTDANLYVNDAYIGGDIWYEDTYWDDIRVPGLQVELAGLRDPNLEKFKDNGAGSYGVYCYYFDQDILEEVHFSIQLPHSYKEGTDIYPHVHWAPTTTSGGSVRWGLEYCWANVNDTFPTNTIRYTTNDTASGIANHQQIAAFTPIDGTGKKISSMLLCRLYRGAVDVTDTYPNEAVLLEVDFHFQIDAPGSRQEYIK